MPASIRPGSPSELKAFGKALGPRGALHAVFDRGEITVVRVPARLDVMGGIADYSGANVCQLPLAHGAVTGIQKRRDRRIRVVSAGIEEHGYSREVEMRVDDLYRGARLRTYPDVHALLGRDPHCAWAAYLVGALFVLLKEGKLPRPKHGLNIGMLSNVPMNVGIGSSATVEVSVLYALDQLLGLGLAGVDLGRLGQMAENRVVGAPCGIMDQLVVACGRADHLLRIFCQPDIVCGSVDVPDFCAFAGINSKVKHSVGGDKYASTRVATFMGRKIIFDRVRRAGGLKRGEQPFDGYLCNIGVDDYAGLYRDWLPARMTGAAFLGKYKTTEDPVATVDPERTYYVESRTSHPIHETERVRRFISRLTNARLTGDPRFLVQAGELMYGSHWSYASRCGQSCRETDFLVAAARKLGVRAGVYGAKITGGGSGGTVAILAAKDKLKGAVERIVDAYGKAFGLEADVFVGSSPGACEFGSTKMRV